jgi:hypothetical protein
LGVFARRGTRFELSRFAVLASLLAAVLAQSPVLELEWTAPPECPQRDTVLASVQRRLGASPPAPSLQARVTLVEQEGEFLLALETQGARRELKGPSCAELAEAGALILALLIDPMLLSRPPPPPQQAPAAPAEPPRAFSALLGISGVADYGALPSIAAGWHASLLLDVRAFHLEAFGGTFVSQQLPNATLALDFDAGVRPCWAITTTSVARPLVCAALSFGRTSGTGNVDVPSMGTSLYAAAFLGAGVQLELFWRLGLLLHLEGGMPLTRTFYELDTGPVWSTRLFVARGELAVVARVW